MQDEQAHSRRVQLVRSKKIKLTQELLMRDGLCKSPLLLVLFGPTAQGTIINGGPLLALRQLLRMQGMPLLQHRILHA